MTLRLIGLMSLVLLLSLASFGLLMSYHQDQLMQEVTRTVSEVGRATLRGMDLQQSFQFGTGSGVPEHQVLWAAALDETDKDFENYRHLVEERIIERRPCGEAEDQVCEAIVALDVRGPLDVTGSVAEPLGECFESHIESGAMASFFINVEAVHAEKDPSSGFVLTIPKLTAAGGAQREYVFSREHRVDDDGVTVLAQEEIRLPIPQGGYEALFHRVRRRSLFLFFGVFVVGMVASAGLAAHFTRPIRKLDGAIRQLSAGDLDASVRVGGDDEIGRLSRAFNEMAGRLRSNRDRARELGRREKLSALGRLAAGVAHDVRNPLHSIGLTLQHLSEAARPEGSGQRDEFDRSVEIIRGEIRRLDQLVGNFLRFARSERRERQRIDLGKLFHEITRLVQKEAERRGVTLELQIDEAVPPILVDGEALRSSILNLVVNGFEAMSGGGHLTLALRLEGGQALIEVADTGEGIPEHDQEHVFDFAYTTREGGNGLGLAMVHHFAVEEHGGQVGLDSRPGEGTRVRMLLPVRPLDPEARS